MKRHVVGLILFGLIAVSCGGSDGLAIGDDGVAAAGTCLADDPNCADDGNAAPASGPLPDAISLGNADGEPFEISFGGFFYADGEVAQLCSALAESFPPQCGSVVIDIEGSLDVVLEHVAESFGDPETANINVDNGVYWTDEWINLTGTLQADRLVLE